MINQLVFNKSELKRCGISVIQVGFNVPISLRRFTLQNATRIRRARQCT